MINNPLNRVTVSRTHFHRQAHALYRVQDMGHNIWTNYGKIGNFWVLLPCYYVNIVITVNKLLS